jgi:hypothetical protein
VQDLAEWQSERLAEAIREGRPAELMHVTRQTPRRPGFTAESSLYWVIKGFVQVRQRLLGFREVRGEDGIPRCALLLDPELVTTAYQPRRPFQGWRYFDAADAPADIARMADGSGETMPPEMQRALSELALL